MGTRVLSYGIAGLLALILVMYVVDSIQIRIRLAAGGPQSAYDSIDILYAAALKGSKYQVYADQPVKETCAKSLFPQLGYSPCWYLRRNKMEMLN